MTTTRALVTGRILKRSGLVVLRSEVATASGSTAPQWEGSVAGALDYATRQLIAHSNRIDGPSVYKLDGTLR